MAKEVIPTLISSQDLSTEVHTGVLTADSDVENTPTPLTSSWHGLVEESKKQDLSRVSELDGVASPESVISLNEPNKISSLNSKIAEKIELINRLELRIEDKDDDFERYESLGHTEAENNEWRKRQEAIQARNILRSELILLQEEKINNDIINSSLNSIVPVNQLKEELLYLSLNTPEIEVEGQFKKKILLDAIEDLLDSQIEITNKKIIAIQNRLLTLTSRELNLYQTALAQLEERKALMLTEREEFKLDNAEELAFKGRFRQLYKISPRQDITSFEENVITSIDRKLSWGSDRIFSEKAKIQHSKWATFVDYAIVHTSLLSSVSLPSINFGEEDVMVKFFIELDEEKTKQGSEQKGKLINVGHVFDDISDTMIRLTRGDIWTQDVVLMNNSQVEATHDLKSAYTVLVQAGGFDEGPFEKLYSQKYYPTIPLATIVEHSSPRYLDKVLSRSHFITDALSKLNPPVKPDFSLEGYEEIAPYFHRTADMASSLSRGPTWLEDIGYFRSMLTSLYPGALNAERHFDELFMYMVGKSVNTDDTTRVVRAYCYRGIEGRVIVYVRQSNRIYQFPEDTFTLQKGDSPEIDALLQSLFVFPDGQAAVRVFSDHATTGVILPKKKSLSAGDLARRHYNAVFFPYRHEQQATIDRILNLGLDEKYAEKVDNTLTDNRSFIVDKIDTHLKLLALMDISIGGGEVDENQKSEIRGWLDEFSRGERKASFGTADYIGEEGVSNPDLIFVPLTQQQSTTTEGLLVNLRLSIVIPIPRNFIDKLRLYRSQDFRVSFSLGFYSKNSEEIRNIPITDSGWMGAMRDIDRYAQWLSSQGGNITMPDLDEALRRVSQYCMRTAFGFESPTEMEILKLSEIFQLRNRHKPYNQFFKDHLSDDSKVNQYIGAVNFKAGMNDFVSLLRLHKSFTWRRSNEASEERVFNPNAGSAFANKIFEDIKDSYLTEWDDEVVSYNEEWWKDTIEWWRTPLRIAGYTIASVLAIMFPGLSAGIIAGIATTFITDTALDIGLLGVEDEPAEKEKLMKGIIVKTLVSIGGEALGGGGAQLTAKAMKRLLLKRASMQLKGRELAQAKQTIENYPDEAIEGVTRIARERPEMSALTKLLAQKGDGLPRINSQSVDMQSVINRYGVSVERKTNLFKRLKNFYNSHDKTTTVMEALEGIVILTLTGEIIVLVEECISGTIKDNEFYQVLKLVLLYGVAAGATTVSSMQRSPEMLEIETKVCLEKMGISEDNISLFSQASSRRGLYEKEIATETDFVEAVGKFDDVPSSHSAREKEVRRILILDKLTKLPARINFDPLYLRLSKLMAGRNMD
ncbi:hypothetical protein [Vibrio hepatarius]|uniref:hypothetical protein n=1 Tax=Vibrio hepatarius TaxID=171383 RepID=UPI001C090400|nr:hypothetical protein [Vibrio hepatarius]MBU2899137.1 hypothetical protein [Vibrio hepatarius]